MSNLSRTTKTKQMKFWNKLELLESKEVNIQHSISKIETDVITFSNIKAVLKESQKDLSNVREELDLDIQDFVVAIDQKQHELEKLNK